MKKATKKPLTSAQKIGDAERVGERIGFEKHAGTEPACVEMYACISIALKVATEHGVSRATIESRMGVYKRALCDYMSCKPDQKLSLEAFARMLFDPSILGYEGHRALINEIALRNGHSYMEPRSAKQCDGVLEESLDVTDAAGLLASTIRDAVDVDSDGGSQITETEHAAIAGAARLLIDEASDMIPRRGVGATVRGAS